ncbi:transposase [Salmonella enterica]|uniref:transposase n=1 Tax=Salmonella enterica TaxID=28901 RepID=UPI001E2C1C53|nr:transposase [Salmonella enterica]
MSITMDEEIKRWTAKRKSALVMEIIQGKTTVAEAARAFDLPPSEIEEWVDDAKRGMENALRAKPLDIREQYEKQLKELQKLMARPCWSYAPEKAGLPAGRGRQIVADVQQGLRAEGIDVSVSKLCRWFGLPRRSWYYRSVKAAPKLQEHLVTPIKNMIEENPSFGYRTVAALLGFNKNTVQRIFQLKGWQVRKRPVGFRPRIQPCLRWPQRPTNAGRRTYAGSGLVAMAGVPWRW